MYKITVEELKEYPETDTRYEGNDGKNYSSTYNVPEGVKYKRVEVPTGKLLVRERQVYTQEFEDLDLTEVVNAVNNL